MELKALKQAFDEKLGKAHKKLEKAHSSLLDK
jgi:hypothetical protein